MEPHNEISEAQYDRIESYLQGTMDAGDLEAFSKDMEANSALKKEIEIQRELMLAVEAGAFKESLNSIHEKVIGAQRSSKKNVWLIAASIALLLAVAIWIIQRPTPTEDLFEQYATAEPGLPVTMGDTDAYNFSDAMVDYKFGKHELAIEKWKEIIPTYPDVNELKYFIGSAYFQSQNYQEAITYFTEVLQAGQEAYTDKAQWYLVLAHLAQGDTAVVARIQPNPNSPYTSKIKAIQAALAENK